MPERYNLGETEPTEAQEQVADALLEVDGTENYEAGGISARMRSSLDEQVDGSAPESIDGPMIPE